MNDKEKLLSLHSYLVKEYEKAYKTNQKRKAYQIAQRLWKLDETLENL